MPSLTNLANCTQPIVEDTCDVCLIGAGAAGLYLAARLSTLGLNVVVLEAGGVNCAPGSSLGIECAFSGAPYPGAFDGRAFGWGGSTSRWGGLLAPYGSFDARERDEPGTDAWEHIAATVRARSSAVFRALGLRGRPDFNALPERLLGEAYRVLQQHEIDTVAGEFLPFRRRNLTYLLSGAHGDKVRVYLNAVACGWTIDARNGSGKIQAVAARSPNARGVRVSAASFVVAAGAVESARSLLEIDRLTGQRMLPASAATGRFLSDHLSCRIAHVPRDSRGHVARQFGPVFSKGRMRSFRFKARGGEAGERRHFAHFLFDIDTAAFRLAREILLRRQSRATSMPNVKALLSAGLGIGSLAYHRVLKSRLHIAPDTKSHLQLDVEQKPIWQNGVSLGAQQDQYGRPIATLQWAISTDDQTCIERIAKGFLERWPRADARFPKLLPIEMTASAPKPHDAYHPVGMCRMGTDDEATLDLDLRVKGTANLYVLSTAAFPSAGSANPTFSMFCLGEALAEKLVTLASSQGAVAAG